MFPILELRGAAEARGLAYGRAAKGQIAHSIASYARLFAYRRGMDWQAAQQAALTYLPLLEDAAPEQVAEMRALATGSGQPFAAILALNARTELLAGQRPPQAHAGYEAAMARNIAAGVPQHESFIQTGAAPTENRTGAAAAQRTGAAAAQRMGAAAAQRTGAAAARDHETTTHLAAAAPRREDHAAAPRREDHTAAAPRRDDHAAAAPRRDDHTAAAPRREDHAAAAPRQMTDAGECTTAAAQPAATADGHTLLAQTWDWTGDQRAACVLLRISAPGQPEILTVTEAGILAKIGLNAAGLAVGLNILGSRSDGQTPGMPVHILLRRLLDLGTLAEARAEVRRVRPGASSCVTVADAAGGLASFELTPGAVAEIAAQDGLLSHTNHCLAGATAADQTPLPLISSSEPRLSQAGALLDAAHGAVTVDTLTAILRDESAGPNAICRRPDLRLPPTERVESVMGVVIDCTARVLHLAPDIPADVPFAAVAL